MIGGTYESLVGWRYLLRQRRNPGVLLAGLATLLVGGGIIGLSLWLAPTSGGLSLLADDAARLWQAAVGIGAAASALGACLIIFGLLNTFLTVFSAFGAFMVTIGVAEVILVLGVMNGFQADLRSKIIDSRAHVVIEPLKVSDHLEDYRALADRARQTEGVLGASPTVQADVMLTAPSNLAAIVVVGIDPETIGQVSKLREHLGPRPNTEGARGGWGKVEYLTDPTALDRALLARGESAFLELRPSPKPEAPSPQAPRTVEEQRAVDEMMPFPTPTRKASGPPPTVLVGGELRRNLGLWPGAEVNIISPFGELGPQGPVPKSRPFRVGGWFDTGMLEFDTKLVYGELSAIQRFMGVGDVANAIQIRVEDLDEARQVRDRLQKALGPGVRVTDWQERNSNLFSALKLEKIAMFLVLSINILLAAFSITSTLVMTIIERKREVAILMAMGSTPGAIIRIFVAQGVFIGTVGATFGTLIGLSAGYTLSKLPLPLDPKVYYIAAIPVDVRVFDVVAIILVALLVSLVATVYPARYASRLRPVEGLNSE